MKKLLSSFCFSALVSILIASTGSAQGNGVETSLYLENPQEIILHRIDARSKTETLLVPAMTLPPDSTLAIDIRELTRQLDLQATSPEQVNYSYVVSAAGKPERISRSKSGFVCGIRIVDIPDEEMIATEQDAKTVYCLSMKLLDHLVSAAGDEESSKKAVALYVASRDLSSLVRLSRALDEEERRQVGRVMNIAVQKVGSPIKDCHEGCLVITSPYGPRPAPTRGASTFHKGLDIRANSGTPVVASLPGKILSNKSQRKNNRLVGYGHYVIINHPQTGLQTKYAHLSAFRGNPGDNVAQGELIALSGNTGIGTAPHLHFETLKKSKAVNPAQFLKWLLGQGFDFLRELRMIFA